MGTFLFVLEVYLKPDFKFGILNFIRKGSTVVQCTVYTQREETIQILSIVRCLLQKVKLQRVLGIAANAQTKGF